MPYMVEVVEGQTGTPLDDPVGDGDEEVGHAHLAAAVRDG
jgi:hypothetical protein